MVSKLVAQPLSFWNTVHNIGFVSMATIAVDSNKFLAGSTVFVTGAIGKGLGMTQSQISWISAPVFQLVIGHITDLLDRKIVFISSMGVFSVICVLVAFAQNPFWMDIVCGTLGSASTTVVPSTIGILGAASRIPSQRKVFAFTSFLASNPLGLTLGNIVCEVTARFFNWQAGFNIMAMIWAILGVAFIWIIPNIETFEQVPFRKRLRFKLKQFDLPGTFLTVAGIGIFTAALTYVLQTKRIGKPTY
jgi:MFS family permease